MAATVAQSSVLEGYLTSTSKYFDHGGKFAETAERIMMLIQYLFATLCQAFRLSGNEESAKKCNDGANAMGAARGALGVARIIFPAEKFITPGKLVYQRYSAKDAENACHRDAEKPQGMERFSIMEGAYKRVQVDNSGKPIKVQIDGTPQYKYVSHLGTDFVTGQQVNWTYLKRDWMDILMDILVLAARLLSPFTWLHGIKAVDLGKHAKGLNYATSGLWSAVITLNFAENVRDLLNEDNPRELPKAVFNTISAGATFATVPVDVFGVVSGMNGHPVLGLLGAGVCLLDAAIWLAKDAKFYS